MPHFPVVPALASAACRGMDPDLFHPQRGQPVEPARQVCRSCPEVEPCLAFALGAGPALRGVWGGTSEHERRVLRREMLMTDLDLKRGPTLHPNGHAPGDSGRYTGPAPELGNGQVHEPAPAVPGRSCVVCSRPVPDARARKGATSCSPEHAAQATRDRKNAAALRRRQSGNGKVPTPGFVVPLGGPTATPNPAVMLAAWGSALESLDQIGVRVTGLSIEMAGDTWTVSRHPSTLDTRSAP